MQGVSTVAQMNTRLNRSLKEAGDAALAEAGVTPTEIIRELWEKISRGTADIMQVREVLLGKAPVENGVQTPVKVNSKAEALVRGRALFNAGLEELDLKVTKIHGSSEVSDDEAYALALVDRMQERLTW